MRRKRIYLFSLLPPLILSLNAGLVLGSESFLDTLFSPLRDLNIASFYASNHYWVDFFIFLFIFIPVAKLTVGRRFGGREGRVLSLAIGLVLALSLALMERRIGFSVQSFGPIAAAILIFLVGLVVFYIARAFGSGSVAAGSIALVITYFLVRATVPNFFLWLAHNKWAVWLHAALVLAVAISIWKVIKAIWPKSDVQLIADTLESSHNPDSDLDKNLDLAKEEIDLIKRRLERITKKGRKESKEIIEELQEMIKIINEYGDTDRGRHLISEKINNIAPRENFILKQMASLKELSQKIERFDLRSFKELKAKLARLSGKDRDVVKEELVLEKRKLLSEEKLGELESELIKYDKDFRYCLSMAAASLKAGQAGQAREWLSRGIQYEEGAVQTFKEMKDFEDRLLKLTKKEYKAFKAEKKGATG